jgi:hypothetical protein
MQVRYDHVLATLFGRLITLAQRILINFLTQQLFIPMSHYSYHRIPFASRCILYFFALIRL